MNVNTPAKKPFWSVHKGGATFSLVMLAIGILLVATGLPNEMRIRPYKTEYNCVEEEDIDGFSTTYCETDPPEYVTYAAMAWGGFAMIVTGCILVLVFFLGSKDLDQGLIESDSP
jgi:hypothetical protein